MPFWCILKPYSPNHMYGWRLRYVMRKDWPSAHTDAFLRSGKSEPRPRCLDVKARRGAKSRGPGTVMLVVGRVHTLSMRGQLTRVPGTAPSGFGRSVRAPCVGTVNPRRHPKAVEPHCHQGRPGESRGPGTVMLAVGRAHTLYMRGQLTRIPGTVPGGFGRSVRAPRTCPVNPRGQPIQRPWSLIVTNVVQVNHR